jgi:hypothetical protein
MEKLEPLAWFSDSNPIEAAILCHCSCYFILCFFSLMVRTAQDAPVNYENSHCSHPRIDDLPCEFLILVWWGKFVDIGISVFIVSYA